MSDDPTPKEHVFSDGDQALIVDRRERQYLVQLTQDNRFESHVGNFDLSKLIGMPYGSWLTSPSGHKIIAYKPTLADITPNFPSFRNASGRCLGNATGGGTWVEATPFTGPFPFRIDPIQRPIYIAPESASVP